MTRRRGDSRDTDPKAKTLPPRRKPGTRGDTVRTRAPRGERPSDPPTERPTERPVERPSERPTERPARAVFPRASLDDDRPTELYELEPRVDLARSRDQLIAGSTILEIIKNPDHKLARALAQLVARAQEDLAGAQVDARASLSLRHDFEFDRRIGYVLKLKLFDRRGRCVQVDAELDQDGRAIRRGSMIAKLISI